MMAHYLLVCREMPGTDYCFWTGYQWSERYSEAKRYSERDTEELTEVGLPLPPWLTTDIGWIKETD